MKDPTDISLIDPHAERDGGDNHVEMAVTEALFGFKSRGCRQAGVIRGGAQSKSAALGCKGLDTLVGGAVDDAMTPVASSFHDVTDDDLELVCFVREVGMHGDMDVCPGESSDHDGGVDAAARRRGRRRGCGPRRRLGRRGLRRDARGDRGARRLHGRVGRGGCRREFGREFNSASVASGGLFMPPSGHEDVA